MKSGKIERICGQAVCCRAVVIKVLVKLFSKACAVEVAETSSPPQYTKRQLIFFKKVGV